MDKSTNKVKTPNKKVKFTLQQISVKNRCKLIRKLRLNNSIKAKQNCNNCVDWLGVYVVSPSNITKQDIIDTFGDYVEDFVPFGYHFIRNKAVFYVEGSREKFLQLSILSKRLLTPKGSRCKFMVNAENQPRDLLTMEQEDIVRQTLLTRYSESCGLLNLDEFHLDKLLLEHDILAPVTHFSTYKIIEGIIDENIPSISSLTLKKNKIRYGFIAILSNLVRKYKIKSLNLNDNLIECIALLMEKEMNSVVELYFLNNPIAVDITFEKIKELFPKLEVINGMSVEAYFETEGHLMPHKLQGLIQPLSHIKLEDNQLAVSLNEECLKKFTSEYFSTFDGNHRNTLLNAYIPTAIIQLISHNVKVQSASFNGIKEIDSFLASFPETMHEIVENKMIPSINNDEGRVEIIGDLKIKGLDETFKFCRKMVIVLHNEGMCCSIDTFEIK